MEEQSRLQDTGDDVGPEHELVNEVQLARVLKSVESEGDEAEKVEVGGARSGPAAEKDVQSDGEIDETDEAQPLVPTAIGRFRNDNHWSIKRHPIPRDLVVRLGVDAACAVDRTLQVSHSSDRDVIYSREQITVLNAREFAGTVGIYLDGLKATT